MVLAACADPAHEATTVATLVTATVKSNSIEIEARFIDNANDGGYSFIEAAEARVQVGDRDVPLHLSENLSFVGRLDIPSPIAGDVQITGTTSLEGASTTLVGSTPSPFSIAASADPNGAQPIFISWSPPSSDEMGWAVTPCRGRAVGKPIHGEVGSVELAPDVFAGDGAFPCLADIAVKKMRAHGVTNGPFESSFINVVRQETITLAISAAP